MGTISKGQGPPRFALVMEPDSDLRAVICSALWLEGHRVECVENCAAVLAWRTHPAPLPDAFVLAVGAGDPDPGWAALKLALDDDAALSRPALIVLLTIRNGLTFPARAQFLQKPFAMEELVALVETCVPPGLVA